MDWRQALGFYDKLTAEQQSLLAAHITERTAQAGEMVHQGGAACDGLLLVKDGQLRAFTVSEQGRAITLYRLFSLDMCLFSASCVMRSIAFDISVQAEQQTIYWHIPAGVYQPLMQQSAAVANYTNEVMATRFSDVMWLLDQILNKKLDARLAAFLLEESALEQSGTLAITHEMIAEHLGSAREVVTRMLRYLKAEGLVELARGTVKITDAARLQALAGDSLR